MSAGLAVVVTAVGGVPGIVTDGVEGLVVEPGRPELLAEAIATVATDESLRSRLGDAARVRSRDFDVARAVEVIEAAYTRMLKER
jgi:glycosyltransferase involved in cell wall biosynthesis